MDANTPDDTTLDILSTEIPHHGVYTSIWPGIYPIEGLDTDMAMQTDIWADFLQEGSQQ